MTDAAGKPTVLNRPSDGSERRVGNNLGIVLEKKPAAATPQRKDGKAKAAEKAR